MSNPASFEEITQPSTPVEKWFADYRVLYEEEVFSRHNQFAEACEQGQLSKWSELFRQCEVAKDRLQHIDVLEKLCDCRYSRAKKVAERSCRLSRPSIINNASCIPSSRTNYAKIRKG